MRSFLSYAFRPFFLLNAVFAAMMIAAWALVFQGYSFSGLPADIINWHAHEMLVGCAMAAIAGFILTAVATWTDRKPVQGLLLVVLVLAWVAGRVAMALSGFMTAEQVMFVDMLFPALLVALVAREVFAAGNSRNYPIVFITLMLALLNLFFHAGNIGWVPLSLNADRVSLYLLIHLVLLLVTVIGGRIIPNFTTNWLRSKGHQSLPVCSPLVDRVTILLTLFTGLYAAIVPFSLLTGILALAAALAHLVRLSRWCGLATRAEPMLFILHVAYLWLPIGYLLTACAVFGWGVPATAALHALTVGAIGLMVMAVSTRVALAHTGRELHAARLTVLAYWVLMLAVVLRVLSPFSEHYMLLLNASVCAWVGAFVLFFLVYYPVLTRPRVDD
jgi:uncharacterized protein involved in response to NO